MLALTVRFALSYNTAYSGVDPDAVTAFAQHAEQCGFEAIYAPEHIVLYPGAKIGAGEIPPALPLADPLELLTFIAAGTERILLGTGILLLPYQHPVVLAKRIATLDALSKGRMRLLTVGVGVLEGEARAVGVDFHTRGRRTDEAIDVMRLLWGGGPEGVSHQGEFFTMDHLVSYPKPYEATDLPIHIGGSSRAAARRAGRRGDGYFAGGLVTPEERHTQLEIARAAAVEAGRDPDALEYSRWGSIDMTAEQVEEYAAQGVTRIVVGAASADPGEQRDQLSAFADRFGLRGLQS